MCIIRLIPILPEVVHCKRVKLRELFDLADINKEEAQLIRFVSSDGYEVTLTAKELLEDRRYYFPGLKENHPHDGSVPGSAEGKW